MTAAILHEVGVGIDDRPVGGLLRQELTRRHELLGQSGREVLAQASASLSL